MGYNPQTRIKELEKLVDRLTEERDQLAKVIWV
jgi:hypothetical protein